MHESCAENRSFVLIRQRATRTSPSVETRRRPYRPGLRCLAGDQHRNTAAISICGSCDTSNGQDDHGDIPAALLSEPVRGVAPALLRAGDLADLAAESGLRDEV